MSLTGLSISEFSSGDSFSWYSVIHMDVSFQSMFLVGLVIHSTSKLSGKSFHGGSVQFWLWNYFYSLPILLGSAHSAISSPCSAQPSSGLVAKQLPGESNEKQRIRICSSPRPWSSLPDAEGGEAFAQQFADIFFVVTGAHPPGHEQITADIELEEVFDDLAQS